MTTVSILQERPFLLETKRLTMALTRPGWKVQKRDKKRATATGGYDITLTFHGYASQLLPRGTRRHILHPFNRRQWQ